MRANGSGDDDGNRAPTVSTSPPPEAGGEIGAARAHTETAVRALEATLRARDARMSERTVAVARLAVAVGSRLGLETETLRQVDLGARLADVGMIGVPDRVLTAEGSLDDAAWVAIGNHPSVGARIVEDSGLRELAPIVRGHHERFDGGGYPDGLRGAEIPLAARVVAVADVYVALTSPKPYRSALDAETALQQVVEAAGTQLDPAVVRALVEDLGAPSPSGTSTPAHQVHEIQTVEKVPVVSGRDGLISRISQLPPPPALIPARDRVLQMLLARAPRAEIAEAVEKDIGLTVAVLRSAADSNATSVAQALEELDTASVKQAVADVPALDFLWPRSPWEATLAQLRLHAVAVQRVTAQLAARTQREDHEELCAGSLLHDIGKLALVQLAPGYRESLQRPQRQRDGIRAEQRQFGLDHAMIGALLARQLKLPATIVSMVGEHHDDEPADQAGIIALADMLAHQAQGATVEPRRLLALSYRVALEPTDLRSILFELPHSAGSSKRRVEKCPLSPRELDILKGLATGKVYAQIARDLHLSTSTIRTHAHNTYSKLGVVDRAQAVLAATARGWLDDATG